MLFRHDRLWKKAPRKITALVGEMMLSYAYDMLYCLSYTYDMLYCCIVYLTLMICCIMVLFIIIWCILLISIISGTSNNNLKAYVPERTCLRVGLRAWENLCHGAVEKYQVRVTWWPAAWVRERAGLTVKVLDKRRCRKQRDRDIVPTGAPCGAALGPLRSPDFRT